MKNFSVKHKLQRFEMIVHALALARIFHENLNATFLSLNCQRYLLNSVSLRLYFRFKITFGGFVIWF